MRNRVDASFRQYAAEAVLGIVIRRRGSTKDRKSPSDEEQALPERAFFCLSPEGKPSGRRPMAALPRRTENDKASYCVQNIVAKRNLFPVTLANRFADSDTNGNKAACRVRNMGNVSVTQYESHEEHSRRPRARRRYAASPDTLAYPGKSREQPIGKSSLFPGGFPGFSKCPGAVMLSPTHSSSGTLFDLPANTVPQMRVQGTQYPGSGVRGLKKPPGAPAYSVIQYRSTFSGSPGSSTVFSYWPPLRRITFRLPSLLSSQVTSTRERPVLRASSSAAASIRVP